MRKILYGSVASFLGACGAYAALAANDQVPHKNKNQFIDNNFVTAVPTTGADSYGKPIANRRDKKSIANPDDKFVVNKAVDGKFTIKGDIGYLYGFANRWTGDFANIGSSQNVKDSGSHAVGYGASLGYTHSSGFGISADYLGFNSKWNSDGVRYDAAYHALTLTPNYRLALDKDKQWGLRLGLGIGLSLSDLNWGAGPGAAGGVAGRKAVGSAAADGAYYSRAGGSKAFAPAYCANKKTSVITDSVGSGGHRYGNHCANDLTMEKTAPISDLKIAAWLVTDKDARLGYVDRPTGQTPVAYDVWSLILKGADGDAVSLGTLSREAGKPVTQADAKSALVRITSGYDNITSPEGYQAFYDGGVKGGAIYLPKNTAKDLGIKPEEAIRLASAGALFRNLEIPQAPPPPAPPAPPRKVIKEVVKIIEVPEDVPSPPKEVIKEEIKYEYIPTPSPKKTVIKEVVKTIEELVPTPSPKRKVVKEVVKIIEEPVPTPSPAVEKTKEVIKIVEEKVPTPSAPKETLKEVVKEVDVPVDVAGRAKGDVGFVLVPQVALEYDNGIFHGDLNMRYLHAVNHGRYQGTGDLAGKTYSADFGPLGLFVGAGVGINF